MKRLQNNISTSNSYFFNCVTNNTKAEKVSTAFVNFLRFWNKWPWKQRIYLKNFVNEQQWKKQLSDQRWYILMHIPLYKLISIGFKIPNGLKFGSWTIWLNNGLKTEVQEIKFVLSYEFDNPEACFELVLGHFLISSATAPALSGFHGGGKKPAGLYWFIPVDLSLY